MSPFPFNPVAYVLVVMIWSSTPLAIIFSSQTIDPYLSIFMRMLIAALLLLSFYWLTKRPLPLDPRMWKSHFYVGIIGMGISMPLVYHAAQALPSTWIALIFGLTPVFTGIIEGLFFKNLRLVWHHWLGIFLAFIGLFLLFYQPDDRSLETLMPYILTMLLSSFLHALSASLVKRENNQLPAIDRVLGALLFSLPLLLFIWMVNGANLPSELPSTLTISTLIYLGIFGSLAGFLLYYQVLNVYSATMSSFITLLAPALALIWGVFINDETVTWSLMVGALLILLGLTVFIRSPADKLD